MNSSSRIRRLVVAILAAGFAAAGVVGFAHVFQPDPDFGGGLGQPAAVQHVHETDPGYTGG